MLLKVERETCGVVDIGWMCRASQAQLILRSCYVLDRESELTN